MNDSTKKANTRKASTKKGSTKKNSEKKSAVPQEAVKKYKILIVDDSKSVLQSLSRTFAKTPYDVTTIANPVTAYQMIEDEHYDIVISDIMMPEMDGLTLLKKIKNYNGMIQVLIITGFTTINNTLNAFRYGAADIFFKPFEDPNEIVAAVDVLAAKLDRINSILKKLSKEHRN